MNPLKKEFIFMILQFLDEMKYKETLHKLEQESKIFFNLDYFKETVVNGELEKAEKYLSAFTMEDDNNYSWVMFFLIQSEMLQLDVDSNKILYPVEAMNSIWEGADMENLYELHEVPLEKFRVSLPDGLIELVEENPMLQDKLMFPNMKISRLWELILKTSESDTMASLNRELIFIILQFLDEEKFTETLHELEQESKIFFNMNYFEQCVINGEWGKSEEYLSAFTRLDDDWNSILMFFLIRRQKYLEALDRNDHDAANKVLMEELNVFLAFKDYPDIISGLSKLLFNKNFRQSKFAPKYVDTASARSKLRDDLKIVVKENPILLDLLMFPSTDTAELLARIKLSLNSSNSSTEKSAIWKLSEIKEPSQCRALVLHDYSLPGKVAWLTYSHSGNSLVGLTYNVTYKLWTWQSDQQLMANAIVTQKLYQPSSEKTTNSEINAYLENAASWFALKKNDSFLFSVSRGKIFKIVLKILFKPVKSFILPPSSAATCLAILPQDDNIIALGFEDSSIKIYCTYTEEIKAILKGHQKRITCLAFSNNLELLVSSGADAQLCVWSTNGWEKQANIFLQTLNWQVLADPPIVSHIEFHKDQNQLLAVCERQIYIYAAHNLERLMQLALEESSSQVTHATYSCDGQSIYMSFKDGSVGVYIATTLVLRCRVNLTAYSQPDPSQEVYPLVIAAHPSEPSQFALGLTNGRVHVLEPLESEGEWGILPPPEDDEGHSTPLVSAGLQ